MPSNTQNSDLKYDSIAFLEQPLVVEECRNNSNAMMTETNVFDRLDDDQLMSMFSDDVAVTVAAAAPTLSNSSNPSTPSAHSASSSPSPSSP